MYNYNFIEIQSPADDTSGNIVTGFPDRNTSEDAYMLARTAANDSTVYCHTVMWITKEGQFVEPPVCYHHDEPVPESAGE